MMRPVSIFLSAAAVTLMGRAQSGQVRVQSGEGEPIVIELVPGNEASQVIELPDGQGSISIQVQQSENQASVAGAPSIRGSQTWLGIGVEPVPPALAEHFGLPPGEAIRVGEVVEGSPASNAGLRVGDLITRLDDQQIMNPEQFIQLIRRKSAGEKIELHLIRKGKPTTVEAVLSSRDFAPEAPDLPPQGRRFWPDGFSSPRADPPVERKQTLRSSARSSTIQNERGTFSFSEQNGHKTFTVKDPQGNILFDGPVNTDEEKANIPEDFLKDLEQMDQDRFHFNPGSRKRPARPSLPGSTL